MPLTAARTRHAQATAADVFHALSDETRLAVLEMLRRGERCVCDLQDELDAAQSRLSFHLKVLKDAGLVTDRKDGRWSYYALNAERFAEVTAVLQRLSEPGSASPQLHSLARASRGASAATAKSAAGSSVRSDRRDGCC